MPVEQLESSRFNPIAALLGMIKGIFQKIVTIILAAVLVVTAGVVAFGVAAVGLMMGIVALLLRLNNRKRAFPVRKSKDSPTVTLDARPTRSGWTVE